MVLLDPEIVWRSAETRVGVEGCLSIPGVVAEIERAAEIEVTWRDLDGRARTSRRFDGFAAICIQHEYRPPRRPRHLRPCRAGGPRRAGGRVFAGAGVTVRPFVPYPDRRLRTPAAPVAAVTDEIRAIWDDMIDTMEAMPGVGLAAPQIGVMLRLAVVDASDERGQGDPPRQPADRGRLGRAARP